MYSIYSDKCLKSETWFYSWNKHISNADNLFEKLPMYLKNSNNFNASKYIKKLLN